MSEEKKDSPQEEKQPTDTAEEKNNDAVEPIQESAQDDNKENKPDDKPEEGKEDSIDELTTIHERTIATLSYISFLAIIPFYLKKDSKFCKFHGKQGLTVAIFFFLLSPFMVLDIIFDVVMLLQIIIFVFMGLGALGGKWRKLPFFYGKACQLEERLTIKTKEEKAEEADKVT